MSTVKYVAIAQELRGRIASGDLKPGDRLPSFSALQRTYRTTQATVQSALTLLTTEGLVQRRHRSGVYVSEAKNDKAGTTSLARCAQRWLLILTEVTLDIQESQRTGGWSAAVVFKALATCQKRGQTALLINPAQLSADEVEVYRKYPPAGIVAIIDAHGATPPPALDHLLRVPVPRAAWGNIAFPSGVVIVEHDHRQGAYELTRWLIANGRRRLLQLQPPSVGSWMDARRAGHLAALTEAGLEPLPFPAIPGGPDYHADEASFLVYARLVCSQLVEYFTDRQHPIDAILAPSDGFVFVLARACRLCGLEPNRDVWLVGYDAYWEQSHERRFEDIRPLATVDKRNDEAGELLVEAVLGGATQPPRLTAPRLLITG